MLSFRQLLVLAHIHLPEKILVCTWHSKVLFLPSCRTCLACTVLFQTPFQHCCSQKSHPKTPHGWYWTKTEHGKSQTSAPPGETEQSLRLQGLVLWSVEVPSPISQHQTFLVSQCTGPLTLINRRWESKLLEGWKSFFHCPLPPWFWQQKTLVREFQIHLSFSSQDSKVSNGREAT